MQVRFEFLGLARQRAGRADIELRLEGGPTSLAEVLDALAQQLPELGRELWTEGRLAAHWTLCLDGAVFVRNPATPVRDGQCLWVMSADAGG